MLGIQEIELCARSVDLSDGLNANPQHSHEGIQLTMLESLRTNVARVRLTPPLQARFGIAFPRFDSYSTDQVHTQSWIRTPSGRWDSASYDTPMAHVGGAVDRHSLHGKVMVGYQGWFNCPGDGMGLGWKHWARDKTQPVTLPSNCVVDLLPDVSEYDADELYTTQLPRCPKSGKPVQVFSSANRKTVVRHFRWMKEYDIDGAFVQRFGNGLHDKRYLRNYNVVMENALAAAEQTGRTCVVMYDLSGMKKGTVVDTICTDWNGIHARTTGSDRYQYHKGKPLVAIWGIGFKDRPYTLGECLQLIKFFVGLKCSIMLGVPTGWREFKRDCVCDPMLHDIIGLVDIVSPWSKY